MNNIILIIDLYGGLVNQIHNINNTIKFCLLYNYYFSFRYCSFRNNNLISWNNVEFNNLFNENCYINIDNYIKYELLDSNENNTYNYNSVIFTNKIIDININPKNCFDKYNKKYIVLKYPCMLGIYNLNYNYSEYGICLSNNKIKLKFENIIEQLFNKNEEYNFIHYRYEIDFIKAYNIEIPNINIILILKIII